MRDVSRGVLCGIAAAIAAAAIAAVAPLAFGQNDATRSDAVQASSVPRPAFEVVSIRRVDPGAKEKETFATTPDGFRATNVPLVTLFRAGWAPSGSGDEGFFRTDRIENLPEWLMTERYDIIAKVAEGDLARWHTREQQDMLREMLAGLLEERCSVQVHRGSREMAVYNLTVAKDGAKNLKPADAAALKEARKTHRRTDMIAGGATMVKGAAKDEVDFYDCSMKSLALMLATPAGRPVVNQTGLTGTYDFALAYMPVQVMSTRDDAPGEGDAPLVFDALEQQLGLKLVPAKGQVETLVVDHVERPTEN